MIKLLSKFLLTPVTECASLDKGNFLCHGFGWFSQGLNTFA
jgi:hypothetical protein